MGGSPPKQDDSQAKQELPATASTSSGYPLAPSTEDINSLGFSKADDDWGIPSTDDWGTAGAADDWGAAVGTEVTTDATIESLLLARNASSSTSAPEKLKP